jgi:hypothetical protein
LQLWALTRAAVQAAGTAADAYVDSGGWVPRVKLPTLGAFDSGWPNLQGPDFFAAEDAPIEYSALFSAERDRLRPIAHADVPELEALISHAMSDPELRPRLTPPSDGGRTDLEDRMVRFEAEDLVLSLLERVRASGGGEDGLLALYVERERAWLLNPLPVEYVVPLALTALDLDAALAIDERTRIEPLDAATQMARAPRSRGLSNVPDTVIGAATHAIVLTGYELPNPGPGPRLWADGPPAPLDDADLVCEALRIITDADVGYAQVLRRPVGWADRWKYNLPPLTTMTEVRRYPDRFDNYGWLRPPRPVPRDVLDQLPTVVAALHAAESNVRLAARRLSTAALRVSDDDRTIDACIGLEALLGEGRDEMSHRLGLRAATALATRATDPLKADVVYTMVKKVYNHRSAVVHGTSADKTRTVAIDDSTFGAAPLSIWLLRELVTDALHRGWGAHALDELLLDSLSQGASSSAGQE